MATKLRISGELLRHLLRLEEGVRVLEVLRTDLDIFEISLDGCPIKGEVTWDTRADAMKLLYGPVKLIPVPPDGR